jgi:hypothetical protein
MTKNPNKNCLAGMRCPNCGDYGPFNIQVVTMAVVNDDGVDETGDQEWDDVSPCVCRGCNLEATVKDFRESNQ